VSILDPTPNNLILAAQTLKKGHLVAIPTETVYGLAAVASSESAVSKIFKLKGRPATNPLIVHLSSISAIEAVASVKSNELSRRINRLSQLMPGPLSLVLPARTEKTASAVRAGGSTVAIRIPSHDVALELLHGVSEPLAAPSANISNRVSPTLAIHVQKEFGSDSLMIIDGGRCVAGLESTVLDITSEIPIILRPGTITPDVLRDALGEEIFYKNGKETNTIIEKVGTQEVQRSPGGSELHYSIKTKLYLKSEWLKLHDRPSNFAWLYFSNKQRLSNPSEKFRLLSISGDTSEAASSLYLLLRELDEMGVEAIIVDDIPEEGIGLAIKDRLNRASVKVV
jgi:L-threonylcarbamoyladenylate synthase